MLETKKEYNNTAVKEVYRGYRHEIKSLKKVIEGQKEIIKQLKQLIKGMETK